MATTEYVPAPKKHDHTFAALVAGREVEYPTLARAVLNTRPAQNVDIEWTVHGEHGGETWTNHTQIFRHPYKVPVAEGSFLSDEKGPSQALSTFLRAVEQTLEWGVPSVTKTGNWMTVRTCGGYRHYLNRDLNPNDVLVLRPLREPFLWVHEWRFNPSTGTHEPLDFPMFEWLAELSLEVRPG